MRALVPPRSTPARDEALKRLSDRRWDLLVVGGGITGMAVARDAALRGLATTVIERQDFAFGTSSRSSRLVHGGLRYLANFDLALVREGLVERRRLLDCAPGLVRPAQFVYPVYRNDPDSLWKVALGVHLYESLSFGYRLGKSRRYRRRGLIAALPGLRRDFLKGGVAYTDAATHDTRLTLAVGLGAARAGAHLVSRCGALRTEQSGAVVTGARVQDRISEREFSVSARAVVLCCGPWQKLYPKATIKLRTARGTHLSVRCRRLPLNAFVALRSPRDGRLAFAMPVGQYVVLGTTDADDMVEPGLVRPTEGDSDYLLELANHAFPAVDVSRADIAGAWAGLRPLVSDGSGEDADKLSRSHQVVAGPPGLWILTGGKLTTHRKMAEDCLDTVAPYLEADGVSSKPCSTHTLPLLEGNLERARALLSEQGLAKDRIVALEALYGSRTETLAERAARLAGQALITGDALLEAQVEMAVEEEWALSLDDLLLRRIGSGQLDLKAVWALAPASARKLGDLLGWSHAEEKAEVAELRGGVERDLRAAGASSPS
ncbi:MAG: glycerol-3-phosphate dehydrogenase/oxidase [Acidobacteriota bacterium]|nr:glycerol-3-phosphate dehydrogenase/oxidase [Acidobacteriota bacterium]